MATKPEQTEQVEIKEYADGWITERKGTEVPVFLKFANIVIIGGAAIYFFIYMNGEITHSERGSLVQALNAVTRTADPFMYIVGAMIVVYLLILVAFVFRKGHAE